MQLVYGRTYATHTSLQVNSAVLELQPKKDFVRLVDIPGHPRVRDQFRDYVSDAKAVAFVVDSNSISRNGAAVAE
jgi:signal recognition particle receptor subunit beta